MKIFKSVIIGATLVAATVAGVAMSAQTPQPIPSLQMSTALENVPATKPLPDPDCIITFDNESGTPIDVHAALITGVMPFQETDSDFGLKIELDDGKSSITFSIYMHTIDEVKEAYHGVNDIRRHCQVIPKRPMV